MQLHFAEVGGVHQMKVTNFCIFSHRAVRQAERICGIPNYPTHEKVKD